jgi:hypothetical protein
MRGTWRCGALVQLVALVAQLAQLPSGSGAWLALWPGSGGEPAAAGGARGARGAARPWPDSWGLGAGGPASAAARPAGSAPAPASAAVRSLDDVPRVLFERIGAPVSECKRAVADGLGRDLLDSAQLGELSASQQRARRRALEGAALALANCHIGELGAAGGLAAWQPYAAAQEMDEAHFGIFTQFLLAAERALGELEHERRQRGVEEMLAALYGEAAATREAVRDTSATAAKGADLAKLNVKLQRRTRAEQKEQARALQRDLRALRNNATVLGERVHGAAGTAHTLAALLAEQRAVLDGVLRDSRELRDAVERGRSDFATTMHAWAPALNAVRIVTENRDDWLRPLRTAAAYLAWAAAIWLAGPALAGPKAAAPLFVCLAAETIVPDAAWHWAGLDAIAHKRTSEQGAKDMRNAAIMISLAAALCNVLYAHLPTLKIKHALRMPSRPEHGTNMSPANTTTNDHDKQAHAGHLNNNDDTVAALVDAIVQMRIANPALVLNIPKALLGIISLPPPGYKVRTQGDDQGELLSDDINQESQLCT